MRYCWEECKNCHKQEKKEIALKSTQLKSNVGLRNAQQHDEEIVAIPSRKEKN